MPIIPLDTPDTLEQAIEASHTQPVLLFKHSVSCPVSASVQAIVNRLSSDTDMTIYRLVVQAARPLSNTISERFNIRHESPQMLVLANGALHAHASHYSITTDWVKVQLETA